MTFLTLAALPLALLVTVGVILHWPIRVKPPLSAEELRRKRAIWQNILEKRR